MTPQDVHVFDPASSQIRLGLSRCALTGAVVLAVLFGLCWLAAAVGLTGSHMFVSLFTLAPMASSGALAVGLFWSLVSGGVAGVLVAIVYNALSFLARG